MSVATKVARFPLPLPDKWKAVVKDLLPPVLLRAAKRRPKREHPRADRDSGGRSVLLQQGPYQLCIGYRNIATKQGCRARCECAPMTAYE